MSTPTDTLAARLSAEFHLVEQGATCLLFDIEHLRLFGLNPEACGLVRPILGGHRTPAEWPEGSGDQLTRVISKLLDRDVADSSPVEENEEPALERLVLHISNRCNLRCRYCYAAGGTYGEPESDMQAGVARATIDYFYQIYGAVRNVQFFGGEPLLNPDALELVCRYVSQKHAALEISRLPSFSVVTNGTILSPRILDVLADYGVNVTVSIDGPEHVHDYLRGRGTYRVVARNVEALRRAGIEVGVECTFTRRHLDHGIDVAALMEFFYREFGLHVSHIPFVSATADSELLVPPDDLKASYARAIQLGIGRLTADDYVLESFGFRLLRSLVYRKKTELYCPAGATTLAVSSTGDIYPCFMFTGDRQFLLGNAVQGRIDGERLKVLKDWLRTAIKWDNPECSGCWARSLCFGCLGNDYIVSGSLDRRTQCDFNRHISRVALLDARGVLDSPEAVQRIVSLAEGLPVLPF